MTLILSIRASSRACGVFELASMKHHLLKPFDIVSNMVEAIQLGPSEFSPWNVLRLALMPASTFRVHLRRMCAL